MTFRFAVLAAVLTASAVTQAQDLPTSIVTLPPLVQPADAPVQIEAPSPFVVFAPAPALSSIRVYGVGSSNCGWEYPAAGQMTTNCDHGGAQLRVAVLEIGYGSNAIAWMNGGQLPRSAQYASTTVCITGSNYTWPCTAGQTVVGWLNEYNLDGQQSGLFKYQNTSTNAPWNTISTQINIR
ncbi:hypothetical protein GCM10009552_39020 [Rothia nasimurium]|uniref:DUF4879 domain-containing protein n=1 Tax=Luteibacter anthropi TaxID=564369 RepID=A0A7X5ZKB8_9GAMM|nr:YolA family protein [Luteibacter anthropi]NII08749.1 DUF4879 domain-containing protein [Luteibacter anthropi]